jgi:hypothetical protein
METTEFQAKTQKKKAQRESQWQGRRLPPMPHGETHAPENPDCLAMNAEAIHFGRGTLVLNLLSYPTHRQHPGDRL